MMLFFLALEVLNAMAMIILALILSIRDGGKECPIAGGDDCGMFNLTIDERFYFFWFLLAKATFALFLGLIAVAVSLYPFQSLLQLEFLEFLTFSRQMFVAIPSRT